MSLANDYRPSTWEDVTEQGLTVKILRNICEQETLSCRNFLLTGPAGTGKTTLARLMARKLNDDIENCEIIEIDGASTNGADAAREIAAQAQTYPVVGKYKCVVYDEVHALSSAAWSVLLKVLENAPAKTVWILATTNPEKIPGTILSRVQQFRLSKISLQGIESRLKYVLDSEIAKGKPYTYNDDGISFIAKAANGGMRDALSLLDKLLAYTTDITSETASEALLSFDYNDFFALLGAEAKKDNAMIAEIVDRVYNSGTNFVRWFEDFHSFVMNVAKFVVLQDITKTTIPAHFAEKLSKYSMAHYTICLRLANVLLSLNQELRTTQYQQEVALTRLCFPPTKKAGVEK
jgi:DNA polymerase-3 subunit gamma/tau